jgi:hypothetical protein
MKRNKVKRVMFAETKKEFCQMMQTYCNMQLGFKHPLTHQSPLWWGHQYDTLNVIPDTELFKTTPVLRIEKIGKQWHDTQEWTGEFHGVMGKVIMLG